MGLTPNFSATDRIVNASTPAASAIAMAPHNTRSRLSGTGLRASAPAFGDIAFLSTSDAAAARCRSG
jgi:hypothetical protein